MSSLCNINRDGAYDGQPLSLENFQVDLEKVFTMSQLVGKSAEERKPASVMLDILGGTNLGAVVGEKGGVMSIPGKEGINAQVWVNVRGGMRMFAAYFWNTEGWLKACDANMSPMDFEKSLWFRKDRLHVIAPEGVSTCRSKNAQGECGEKVYDYVIACNSLKGKISQMNIVEDSNQGRTKRLHL